MKEKTEEKERIKISDVIEKPCYWCYDQGSPHPECPWFDKNGFCNSACQYDKYPKLKFSTESWFSILKFMSLNFYVQKLYTKYLTPRYNLIFK